MKKNTIIMMSAICTIAAVTAGCGGNKPKEETTTVVQETTVQTAETQSKETQSEAKAAGLPFTYFAYDADGTSHEEVVERAPQKIITNNQASTELLLKLGLGGCLRCNSCIGG